MSAASFRKSQAEFGADYVRTDRDNEYMVVSRVTRMLQNARDHGDQFAIIRAVHTNTELWTALAADLASPGNALPDQLKAGLISLAIFSIEPAVKLKPYLGMVIIRLSPPSRDSFLRSIET